MKMNRTIEQSNNRTILFCLTSSVLVLAASAALKLTHDPMPLPQFTFAGRVCDYAHVAYDADQKVEIWVYDGQGNILA